MSSHTQTKREMKNLTEIGRPGCTAATHPCGFATSRLLRRLPLHPLLLHIDSELARNIDRGAPRPLPGPSRVPAYPRPAPRDLAASVVRLQTSTLVPSAGRGTSRRHGFTRQRPERLGAVGPATVRDRWVDARALRRRIVRHRGPELSKVLFSAQIWLCSRV